MGTPGVDFGLNSNCCESSAEFEDIYGCLPTGIQEGDVGIGMGPASCYWSNIFGSNGFWEQSSTEVINIYNRDQASSRNCIDFRNKCRSNNYISLKKNDDCCTDEE